MAFEVQHQVDLPTDTLLQAQLKDLEHKKIPYTDKKTGEQKEFGKLNWVFEITEQGDYHGKLVRAETSDYLSDSPYNQFNNFAKALLRRELTTGQVLSEGDLIGLSALITVKYEEDRRDSSKKWARVADVFELDPVSAAANEPPF
jgi:hypothetical protein